MSMIEWAKREVEIACKRENPNRKEGEWDYGCSCYESALKAYMSLMDDNHSGMSFSITRNILIRLMEGKPLSPIEDVPEMWNSIYTNDDGTQTYQCKRMSSLFKDVHPDGTVSYHDNDRYYVRNVNEPKHTYKGGIASSLIDELFPVTMPYCPPNGYYVLESEEFLTDRKNGDFDTVAFYTVRLPDGTKRHINRFYAEIAGEMRPIDRYVLNKRKKLHREREKREREAKKEVDEA